MTFEEAEAAAEQLTRDLFKVLVMRKLSHRVNTPIHDHAMREIEAEADWYAEALKQRNDIFAKLPRLFVSFDYATRSLVLRWPGELS